MDKYTMFKNYMHNELGITKEDIREWIENSVEEQAEKLVAHEFNNFDIKKIVSDTVKDNKYFGNSYIKKEIRDELTKQIMERISFDK